MKQHTLKTFVSLVFLFINIYAQAQPCFGLSNEGSFAAPNNCESKQIFVIPSSGIYALVDVKAGISYTVTSSVATDRLYFSVGQYSGPTFAQGQGSVTFTSPITGTIYFHPFVGPTCEYVISPGRNMTFSRSCLASVITSISPTSGCADVVVAGSFLTGATSVTVGGVAQSFVSNSDEQLTIVRPTSSGAVAITNPTATTTSTGSYTFVACPASISSFTPSSGCGNGVTVSGTNFTGVIGVTVGGVAVNYTITSSTQIFIPRVVNSGQIAVTTASGTATSTNSFNFTPTLGMNKDNPIVIGQLPCASAPYATAVNTSNVCYYDNLSNSINANNRNSSAPDVWYRFTLSATAKVKITFCGSGALQADPQIATSGGEAYAIFHSATCSNQGSGILETTLFAGTYYIVVQGTNGAAGTISFSASIDLVPAISTSPNPATVCAGQNLTLSASAYSGTTFAWSGGVTNGVAFVPPASGTYTVTATDGNSCSATASVAITVNPLPTVTASPTTQTICQGASATLSGGGAVSYAWSGGVQNGVAFTPSVSGSYTVTGTDARGCQKTATASVTINPLPSVTLSPTQQSFCVGSSSMASLTVSGNAVSYQWSDGISNNTPFPIPAATKTYTVTATGSNGCTKTATAQVIINPLPTITASPAIRLLCGSNQSVTFNGGGGVSYTWTRGVTNGVPYMVTDPPGNYVFTVTGTDANGCQNTAAANLTIVPVSNSSSTTVYVDASKSVSGDGESWATAFKTLDEALFLVSCRTITRINVAAGTYIPTKKPYNTTTGLELETSDNRDKTFHIRDGITLQGGYSAGGGTRNVAANPTILSGDLGTIGNNGDNSYHVVLAIAPASGGVGITIDGFTISGSGVGQYFSALSVNGNNIDRSSGGGIYVVNGNNTFTNNTISNNVSTEKGAGIYSTGASNTLTNNKIHNNSSDETCGGGYFNLGTHTLTGNTIFNNVSFFGYGGGLFFYAANATINNNTINNNTSDYGGAGVYLYQGTSALNNNSIFNNTAPGGAGIYTEEANTTLTNNVFYDNTSPFCCGAAYISLGTHTLTNNTFYNNSSPQGNTGGAGFFCESVTLKNNIFWDNKFNGASNVAGADFSVSNSTTFTTTNNLFQLPSNLYNAFSNNKLGKASGNVFATNPLFANTADIDGADNIHRTADDGLRLNCNSPAANTGTNTGAPTLDILGNAIFATTKDMGAYEQQASEGCALPIQLQSFSVSKSGNGNVATWLTAQERNNSHFNLQRSVNGIDFKTIGRVEGKGNSDTQNAYSFTDNAPLIGHNYYRLQQVDIDGKTSLSKVVAVIWLNNSTISIYPNPVDDILNINIAASNSGAVEIRLTDIYGRVLQTLQAPKNQIINQLNLDTSSLSSGLYLIQVFENNQLTFTERINKVK
jgi:Right handed beta helix region/Secretion system C-terminal sorting domain